MFLTPYSATRNKPIKETRNTTISSYEYILYSFIMYTYSCRLNFRIIAMKVIIPRLIKQMPRRIKNIFLAILLFMVCYLASNTFACLQDQLSPYLQLFL